MRSSDKMAEQHAVILFDGVCHLCQGAVKFIIRRDPKGYFRFASLQSKAAERLLGGQHRERGLSGTIVLIESGAIYTRSTAALRIARGLKFPWPLLYFLIWIPPWLRNHVYDWIAANRYRWFGRDDACMLPAPEVSERFIEDEK